MVFRPVIGGCLNPEERDILIRTIAGEAECQGRVGWEAVCGVILNRAAPGNAWPDSIRRVVMQPRQFECWDNPLRRRFMNSLSADSELYRDIGQVVDEMYCGRIPDPTGGRTYFMNTRIVEARYGRLPSWLEPYESTGVEIGDHTFYGDPNLVGSVERLCRSDSSSLSRNSEPRVSRTAPSPSLWDNIVAFVSSLFASPRQGLEPPASPPVPTATDYWVAYDRTNNAGLDQQVRNDPSMVRAIQEALRDYGYHRRIDTVFGSHSQEAWNTFERHLQQTNPTVVTVDGHMDASELAQLIPATQSVVAVGSIPTRT